jgi:hypothetical protein
MSGLHETCVTCKQAFPSAESAVALGDSRQAQGGQLLQTSIGVPEEESEDLGLLLRTEHRQQGRGRTSLHKQKDTF